MCAAQDIIDATKILREMGSHIVVGVSVGGKVQSTLDLSTNRLDKSSSGLMDEDVEETLRGVIKRAKHEQQRQYRQKSNAGKSTFASSVMQSQSVTMNPSLRKAISNDPIRSVQTWESEIEEERANNAAREAAGSEEVNQEDGIHDEYDMQRNPYQLLFPKAEKKSIEENQKPNKKYIRKEREREQKRKKEDAYSKHLNRQRRRRLLSSDDHHHPDQNKQDEQDYNDEQEDMIVEDYQVKDTRRVMFGGSYFPRSITAPAEADISTYWDTVPQQTGFLSLEVRPLLDVITHTDVVRRCFGKKENEKMPKTDDYHRTVLGRKLLRRKIFWENFLMYMNIKVEAMSSNRKRYRVEEVVVERATLTKMEMVRRFQKFALSIDRSADGNGMMLTKMGGWTRLSGLIRESKDASHMLDMLSSVTGIILTHSRLLIHSRAMCRADAEDFERRTFFRGLVVKDIPMTKEENDKTLGNNGDDGTAIDPVTQTVKPDHNGGIPSLHVESKFIIGASYQLEKECLQANLRNSMKIFDSVFAAVTIEQYALKSLMNALWSMSSDFGVQIIMNELRLDREFITSNRGLNNGRKSSTAALCEREKSKTEIELCHMMVSVVRQSIVEHLEVSARDLSLDPTIELSRLLSELMDNEPLLFKYRKQHDPRTNVEWTRLNKANDMMYILFGAMSRKDGFVMENGLPRAQDIVSVGSEANTKAKFDLRNLIGELSKSEEDMSEEAIQHDVQEMLKSNDVEECSTFSSLRIQYQEFQRRHESAIRQQECSVCEYYVNLNRMYGRPSLETWRDDVNLWPTELPSEDAAKGSGPKDPTSENEKTSGGEDVGALCDRSYFAEGDGLTTLDRAEAKCGGAPFAFIDDGKKKSGTSGSSSGGGSSTSTSFMETKTLSPLDVAMAISQPKGGASMLGLSTTQKKIITEMNQKRMKQEMLPKSCEGISLQPGQVEQIRTQVGCVVTELKSTTIHASATKKQCKQTVKKLKPLLINQLKALSRAAGTPTSILGGEKSPRMSLVVSQIESMRAKVFSPSGFCRPDIPNPNALQDIMLHPQSDSGANDLCVDIGYCTGNHQASQNEFLLNMIASKDLWHGTDVTKTIKTIVPPGFEPKKMSSGG